MAWTWLPILDDFFDDSVPLPEICWETVPLTLEPRRAWEGFDQHVPGWVPVWYPTHDCDSGRSLGEFERAALFADDLECILRQMHRWPLWGSKKQRKQALAIAILQLYCETETARGQGFCGA